jgi:NAD(P)-dependent dehydrogenase (short-subunit alcohol dehydrogenase family)
MGRLEGKVAIVTGGASGMGEASVRLFVQEGARVAIADVQDDRGRALEAEMGGKAIYVHTDVSRSAEVAALVDATVAKFGGLNILFNNAGICIPGKNIIELPEEEFDRQIAINLKGVWLGMKYGLPHLIKAGGGAVINTASTSGLAGYAGLSGYGTSKGGVVALTRHAAVEFAAQAIRVNCICPGAIFTPMTTGLRKGQDVEAVKERNRMTTPLMRLGLPEDIAKMALFLASDDSVHVTGNIYPVDGGQTMSIYRGPSPRSEV